MKKMSEQNNGTNKKINSFVSKNSYVVIIGLVLFFMYVFVEFGSIKSEIMESQKYIKKNIGQPIMLSATGQVIVAEKSPVTYYDPRMKQYVANILIDNLIQGMAIITKAYTVFPKSGKDMVKKNKRFAYFNDVYLLDEKQLLKYANTVQQAIIEDKYPEVISPYDMEITRYKYDKSDNTLEIKIKITATTKSWTKAKSGNNKWVNKKIVIKLDATAVFDAEKYADISNPFGLKFKTIILPVPLKPAYRQ